MTFAILSKELIPAIEAEMHSIVEEARQPETVTLVEMLDYHLGWDCEGSGLDARGKRLRPQILLLTTASCGETWERSLPAAAAVELIHNFSLIHDDIQDQSPLRRGRKTVWKKWGVAQAINTGDTMFTLAQIAILRQSEHVPPEIALKASLILQKASLELTQGQFLDISYETRDDLNMASYWPMVSGKTSALLGVCTELGALLACASASTCAEYHRFGRLLGLAFQIQDDLLGIWGNAALTGKSAESDLLAGKKTLPVLYALEKKGKFSQRWNEGPITPEEVSELANQLEAEGALEYTNQKAEELTEQALNALEKAQPQGEVGNALRELANRLLGRQS